jgi:hypothetical protein
VRSDVDAVKESWADVMLDDSYGGVKTWSRYALDRGVLLQGSFRPHAKATTGCCMRDKDFLLWNRVENVIFLIHHQM